MPGTVIFDMDGVLTDSEPVINESAVKALREHGVDAKPEDFIPFVGTGEDSYIGGVAEKYGLEYRPAMKQRVYEIYLDILPGRLRAFPGIHDLVETLRDQGWRVAVASSADRIKVEANLKAIDLPPSGFSVIVAGEDVVKKKPAPDIFLTAAERVGTVPRSCCVVEDAPSGIRAAKAAGMRCVAVAQTFTEDELRRESPDLVKATVAELIPDDFRTA